MGETRTICVFTSSRADFGLLRPVMDGIVADAALRLQVLASGSHLVPELGHTIDDVRDAGFDVDATVDLELSGDTPVDVTRSMGLALSGYGAALDRLAPDLLLVLGDRYETLCVAAAAQVCRIPVAHVHGGEVSEGAIDDAFRHAITKMSHLHFASCAEHRRRILQLGERPERVFDVGALGVENARTASLLSRAELAEVLDLPPDRPLLLVTFHPVTLEHDTAADQFAELLAALDAFPDHAVLLTAANADTGGRVINEMIKPFAASHPDRVRSIASLGAGTYLSAMRHADAVVGNSSSGLLEAPAFRVPTVNIGDRQKGRVRAASVIDCPPRADAIVATLRRALSAPFRASLETMVHPCERPNTAATIVCGLREACLAGILKKPFIDLVRAPA